MAERALDILVLHGMGPKRTWFSGVADVELMFPKYDKNNHYFTHNCFLTIPDFIVDYPFDAVIMMSTFMDKVAARGLNSRWIRQYEFLKKSEAVKIVFPQDDYWFSEIKDQFYVDYHVHKVHPISPEFAWPELIPRYLNVGGLAEMGYTTYVTPRVRALKEFFKPWDARALDVVYRATKTPKAPNRFGLIKGVIGDRFLMAMGESKLRVDISTEKSKLLYGDKWYEFLARSKCVLGSNSGSSVRLANHQVYEKLLQYQLENPDSKGLDIEAAIFSCDDRNRSYTCISPRNVEAAMIGTLQLLTPGEYGGFLKPYKDYLPIDENCSNISEVCDVLKNKRMCLEIIQNCRDSIEQEKKLNVENLIEATISFVHVNRKGRHSGKSEILRRSTVRKLELYSTIAVTCKDLFLSFPKFILSKMPFGVEQKSRNIIKKVFR